ncbi:MAG: aldehyde dehydrogenase [Desulfomonilaceae bacterium]
MDRRSIESIFRRHQEHFDSGKTRDLGYRVQQLRNLKNGVQRYEDEISQALKLDLNKPRFEAYLGEIALILKEIDFAISNLPSWAKPKKVFTPLVHFPAASYIYPEPLGVVLIIGPWNYPAQLILVPLVSALAAGNCAVIKPSSQSANTSRTLSSIISESLDPSLVTVVEGGSEIGATLLEQPFAHIFFTGGTAAGRVIAQSAARNLIPVTLELGGKSPCIVERDVNLEYAARRIVWGKFFNAGQTCVAPDYVLVHREIKSALLELFKSSIKDFYGEDPKNSPDYARIVNHGHFERLARLIGHGNVIEGGQTDRDERYISPTILDNVSFEDEIMKAEIFGPILPVIEYSDLAQAVSLVNRLPKPLALYFFSRNKEQQNAVLAQTSFGGGAINDTLVHFSSIHLPFGGVGNSGLGRYHGKAGFDTFSNKKSVIKRSMLFDISLRYPPYKNKFRLARKIVDWFG